MIAGLANSLPRTLTSGLQQQGVPSALAHQIGSLPPVASLFAAVLGVNPVQHVLAARGALSSLSAAHQRVLTGRQFFPDLISGPFHQGLSVVLAVATALAAIAALASLLRGRRAGSPQQISAGPGHETLPGWDTTRHADSGCRSSAGHPQAHRSAGRDHGGAHVPPSHR